MQKDQGSQYFLSEDEEYMSYNHCQYFKNKLLKRQRELMAETELFFEDLKKNDLKNPDVLDQSALHAEILLDFTTRDRQGKLIEEINQALDRIASGEYGYCEITGDEIGLKRLDVQPVATRCIEAQEQFELSVNAKIRSAYATR